MGNAPSMASDLYKAVSLTESFEGDWKTYSWYELKPIWYLYFSG